ncbi:MAG TPA: serine/threonine-protein kinase, partial [Baekduia sp.]|nr:serine/threonine-protein kinase [Baekduia sp.]
MLREGDQVGDYELLERLGHGAMGVVFRARHVLIGREAAVKVLLPHLAAEESFRERFRREARTMAGIEHPSIVPIYEAREVDETTVYIAMKLLRGGTLGDRLARGPMPGDEVMRFATEIAAALDVLHDQGLVHRDVKPSNILFDDTGRAVLGDFGVTRDAQETALTRTDQVVGTIRYMSPERMLGQAPGPSADVYSLAAVIHEALRGEPLVAGESEGALVGALMTQDTPALGLEDADLSSRCDVVLAAALDKNPEARTTSASGLVQALVDAGLGATASEAPADETQILGAPAGADEAVDDATTGRADGGDATRTRIDPRGPRPAISASEAA